MKLFLWICVAYFAFMGLANLFSIAEEARAKEPVRAVTGAVLALIQAAMAAAAVLLLTGCGGGDPEPPTEQQSMCVQPLDQPAAPCEWKQQ